MEMAVSYRAEQEQRRRQEVGSGQSRLMMAHSRGLWFLGL